MNEVTEHSIEFAKGKEHSELINKYYAITAIFNNNIKKCATAIRAVGCEERPSFVFKDLEYLWIAKYSEQINKLHEILKKEESANALTAYVKFVYSVSQRYGFKPDDEVNKGDISGTSYEDIDMALLKFSHKIRKKYPVDMKLNIFCSEKVEPLSKEERLKRIDDAQKKAGMNLLNFTWDKKRGNKNGKVHK